MEGFWDKVKKGAQDVGGKAAQLGKIAKLQAEIAGINTAKGSKFAELGKKVYSLYKDGKLADEIKELLQDLIRPIEASEKTVEDKEKEIAEIKKQMGEAKEEPKTTEVVESPPAETEQEEPKENKPPED